MTGHFRRANNRYAEGFIIFPRCCDIDTWEVLERATDRAENERKEEDLLEYPIERTREAAGKLRRARLKYEEASKHPDFDSELMEEKICEVEDALRNLQDSFRKT